MTLVLALIAVVLGLHILLTRGHGNAIDDLDEDSERFERRIAALRAELSVILEKEVEQSKRIQAQEQSQLKIGRDLISLRHDFTTTRNELCAALCHSSDPSVGPSDADPR
jgi:hypothetical protein